MKAPARRPQRSAAIVGLEGDPDVDGIERLGISRIKGQLRRGADWYDALKTARNYQARSYTGPSVLIVADVTVYKAYWDHMLPNQLGYLELAAPHYALHEEPWLGPWLSVLTDAVRRQSGSATHDG